MAGGLGEDGRHGADTACSSRMIKATHMEAFVYFVFYLLVSCVRVLETLCAYDASSWTTRSCTSVHPSFSAMTWIFE